MHSLARIGALVIQAVQQDALEDGLRQHGGEPDGIAIGLDRQGRGITRRIDGRSCGNDHTDEECTYENRTGDTGGASSGGEHETEPFVSVALESSSDGSPEHGLAEVLQFAPNMRRFLPREVGVLTDAATDAPWADGLMRLELQRRRRRPEPDRHRSSSTPRRTLWAAIGAAVAVAVGPSVIPTASATVSSGERAIYVPITPCRLVDTRHATNVGVAPGPVNTGDTYTIQVRGNTDPCPSGIDQTASALNLNVTAVTPTLSTFLTFWGDGPQPGTANLNPSPGQPPTPNAVSVPLGGSGEFRFFNLRGDVHVVIDVMGFYVDHDDRYYTEAESDARFAQSSNVYTKAEVAARLPQRYFLEDLDDICTADATGPGDPNDGQFVECVAMLVPGAGNWGLVVRWDTSWHSIGGPSSGRCRVTFNEQGFAESMRGMGETIDATTNPDQVGYAGGTYAFGIIGALPTDEVGVQCRETLGDIDWVNMTLMVEFLPL